MTTSVAWGDYNSDGRLDILTSGCLDAECADVFATLYRNNNDGSFSEDASERHLSTPFIQLTWGDYNSDNRPDILASDLMWGSNSGIYKNNAAATATPPSPPADLAAQRSAKREITFSWSESDSKAVTESVGYNLRVGTTPGGSDIVSPLSLANGTRQLPQFGNAEGRTFARLKNLRDGTYYWSVQAIGTNFAGSAFASEHKFSVPAKVSLKLSGGKICTCGGSPRSITLRGRINPAFYPVHLVTLKRHFKPHSAWRRFATVATTPSGTFRVRNLGMVATRSFWVRAVVDHSQENRMVSPAKYVTVRNVASCAAKAKR